jgi:hypothetical protein
LAVPIRHMHPTVGLQQPYVARLLLCTRRAARQISHRWGCGVKPQRWELPDRGQLGCKVGLGTYHRPTTGMQWDMRVADTVGVLSLGK